MRRFTTGISAKLSNIGKRNLPRLSLTLGLLQALALFAFGASKAEHVVLVCWDGMRPDFITPEYTPNLWALSQRGTFFANNHSAYITSTEVNGTVLATGCFAPRSGIVANREYRPDIDIIFPISTENLWSMQVGDALRGGKWIAVPTVAETVQQAGFKTVVAATKPVGLLHDRNPDRSRKVGSPILFVGQAFPPSTQTIVEKARGPMPDLPLLTYPTPNTVQNEWTTRALTEQLWQDEIPKYSVLWLGDPDYSQHVTAPGSPTAIAAIKDSDTHLGLVVSALQSRGVLEKTDIFVVSDHGFSTIDRAFDIVSDMGHAGLVAMKEFTKTPQDGEILVVNLGGTVSFYVIGKSPVVIQQIVDYLQASKFAGPIFTKDGLPGTYPHSLAHLDSADAPDVICSFRWRDAANQYGVPGVFVADARVAGYGSHATLSKYDVHNTLVAAGPDLRAGFRDELPSGNVDVAPTILHLLNIPPLQAMDGRVLSEALVDSNEPLPTPRTERRMASRTINGTVFQTYLQLTYLGDSYYLDEGNHGPAGP